MRATTLLLLLLSVSAARGTEKPNIIFILADDMGYGDCTVNNPESKIPTPNIDRLAKEGLRFTDAHSASATCTASRYGLLTGINPAHRGVVNGLTALGPVIDEDEATVAKLLQSQGYTTAVVGKWHLGFEMPETAGRKAFDFSRPLSGGPLDRGFDYFFGVHMSVSGTPYFSIRGREPVAEPTGSTPGTKSALRSNGKDSRTAYPPGAIAPGFVPEQANAAFCDDVVRLIEEHAASNRTKPLFLYYAMLEPHTPWLPTDEFVGRSKAGAYGDYIAQLDHEVGRVLQALKDSGLDQNTLVTFSSDNGAHWSTDDIKQWGHRANGPLAGGKARPEEGGHRVPFIARWPGHVPAGTTTAAIINHTDFLATITELLEVELATTAPQAGKGSHSFLSVLKTIGTAHQRPGMAVTAGSYRLGDWKLTFNRGPRGESPEGREISHAALYNLADDLGETQDLSASQPERRQQLFAAYREYFADLKLKPLAVQVSERKTVKKDTTSTPARRTGTATKAPDARPDVKLSKEQQTKVAALNKEYSQRRAELQKQLDDLLTAEQKQAQDAARKKAMAEAKVE